MPRYELIDHTADVIVRAYGDTLAEAFAGAAVGMFDIITGKAIIEERSQIDINVHAIDHESLLVNFLSELIIRHEVDRMVFGRFEVVIESESRLRATARGEPFDKGRHGHGIQVKAASYHLIEVSQPPTGQCRVQVLLDI